MADEWGDDITDESLAEEMESAKERFNAVAKLCAQRGITVHVNINLHQPNPTVSFSPAVVTLNVALTRINVLRPR